MGNGDKHRLASGLDAQQYSRDIARCHPAVRHELVVLDAADVLAAAPHQTEFGSVIDDCRLTSGPVYLPTGHLERVCPAGSADFSRGYEIGALGILQHVPMDLPGSDARFPRLVAVQAASLNVSNGGRRGTDVQRRDGPGLVGMRRYRSTEQSGQDDTDDARQGDDRLDRSHENVRDGLVLHDNYSSFEECRG